MFSFTKFSHPNTQRTVNPDIGGHLLDSRVFRLTRMKTLGLTKQRPSQQEKSLLEAGKYRSLNLLPSEGSKK